MKHPFYAAKAKVRRATKLLVELEAETAAYMATNPARCRTEVEETPQGRNIKFYFNFEGVPESISVIAGDVIHNLRTALDMTACELARANNKSDKHVYFPFCERPEDLDDMIKDKNFHRAGKDAVALLRTYRPYRGGHAALRAVHDLDVRDKHQSLIEHATSFASPIIRQWDDDGTFNPTVIGDPNAVSAIDLAFGPGIPLTGQKVIPTLHQLVELVNGVVEAFCALANR